MRRRSSHLTRPTACLPAALLALAAVYAHAQPVGEAETRKFFGCRTIVTWSGAQGTQVSYLGAGGKAYLWAPGNDTVLSGNWRIDPRATSAQSPRTYVAVCVQYGAQPGAPWECRPAEMLERITLDHADGDVFALAGRSAVPFRLPRERANIAALQQRIKAQAPDAAQPTRPTATCE